MSDTVPEMRSRSARRHDDLGTSPGMGEVAPRRVISSHKLDIHSTAGAIFQVDGDKFGYGILGEMRGYSDKTNMDSMCELLALR